MYLLSLRRVCVRVSIWMDRAILKRLFRKRVTESMATAAATARAVGSASSRRLGALTTTRFGFGAYRIGDEVRVEREREKEAV